MPLPHLDVIRALVRARAALLPRGCDGDAPPHAAATYVLCDVLDALAEHPAFDGETDAACALAACAPEPCGGLISSPRG